MNRKLLIKKSITLILTLVVLMAVVAPVMARQGKSAQGRYAPAVPSQSQGPTDPAELEAFLDNLLATQMAEYHIPGAAVAVVRDGKVLLAKGYGYANLEKGIPVDPEQTVFRIGSSGKVLTWTAIMQLIEQGKLDLDADINTYLDFRIPDTYPQPITLKHLLTHTPGFEETWYETFTFDPAAVLPPGEWLATHIPARVFPPGDTAAYSNYGAELAGYIVERVSGQSYAQYVQEHILAPLGMVHSSASGRMLEASRPLAAIGYS
jgi:CubicO group peptidase (beta-lactamase class C family)